MASGAIDPSRTLTAYTTHLRANDQPFSRAGVSRYDALLSHGGSKRRREFNTVRATTSGHASELELKTRLLITHPGGDDENLTDIHRGRRNWRADCRACHTTFRLSRCCF